MRKGKKPIKEENRTYGILTIFFRCPKCKNDVGMYDTETLMCYEDKFCRECGQKIDWSEEK